MLHQRSHFRHLVLVPAVMAVMLVLACGGSDDGDSDSPTSAAGSNSPAATSQSSSSSSIPADTAVVTIGSTTYEFTMSGPFGDQCLTLFGVVGGVGQASDGSDVTVDFSILPVGYESNPGFDEDDAPSVEVNDRENRQRWVANARHSWFQGAPEPGSSQVDSYTNDGNAASGTATFIDANAFDLFNLGQGEEPEPVTGTFEVHCG